MGDTTIEWTNKTWNPLTGCTKVSPGCDHCYAKTMHERFNGPGSFDTITLHPERLDQPFRWRKPSRVFVNSMSDLFHKDVPDEFICEVFDVMANTPRHTFQLLTKRHTRMRSFVTKYSAVGVLPNVWLGVSVETQKWAGIRIPVLLDTPAAVRFLSCEPLLGPVCLDPWHTDTDCNEGPPWGGVDWVIVGGESGPGARPMHPEWARSLRDQCLAAGVPFLFKQWGAWSPSAPWTDNWVSTIVRRDGSEASPRMHAMCNDGEAFMSRAGKKAAGRELDGRTWDQYPAGVS